MILQEKHREFAVKSFAKFLTRTQVVDAFIQEFADDLPKPPPITHLTQDYQNNQTIVDELDKKSYINDHYDRYYRKYVSTYGNDAKTKFNQDSQKILIQIEKDYAKKCEESQYKKQQRYTVIHEEKVDQHNKVIKKDISNQLRVYNITHTQFPKKYRELFNKTRKEHITNLLINDPENPDNITQELETLYGFIKHRVFQQENLTDTTRNLDLAHKILKTIADRKQ